VEGMWAYRHGRQAAAGRYKRGEEELGEVAEGVEVWWGGSRGCGSRACGGQGMAGGNRQGRQVKEGRQAGRGAVAARARAAEKAPSPGRAVVI